MLPCQQLIPLACTPRVQGIVQFGAAGLVAASGTSFLPCYNILAASQASEAAAGVATAIDESECSFFTMRHGNPQAGGNVTYVLLVDGVASIATLTLNTASAVIIDTITRLRLPAGARLSVRATHAVGIGTSCRPCWQMAFRGKIQ